MDAACGLRSPSAALDRPGVCFLWADSQKGDQVEEPIAGANDAIEPGLIEPERSKIFGPFAGVGELCQFGFDCCRDYDDTRAASGGVVGQTPTFGVAGGSARFIDIGDVENRLGAE